MPMNEPVLTKRIPSAPWGDPKDRRTIDIGEYVRTGGYQSLEKALASKPERLLMRSKRPFSEGVAVPDSPQD